MTRGEEAEASNVYDLEIFEQGSQGGHCEKRDVAEIGGQHFRLFLRDEQWKRVNAKPSGPPPRHRDAHQKEPAGSEHTPNFSHLVLRIGQVLKNMAADKDVKTRAGERQGAYEISLQYPRVPVPAGDFERRGAHVDPCEFNLLGGAGKAKFADAAPDVEQLQRAFALKLCAKEFGKSQVAGEPERVTSRGGFDAERQALAAVGVKKIRAARGGFRNSQCTLRREEAKFFNSSIYPLSDGRAMVFVIA